MSDRTRPQPGWTLGVTAIAFFMVNLDALVVITALPSIRRELGVSLTTLEWAVNAFTLAYAAGIITAAAAGDRFGRRRIFAGGLALFTLASAACALAPSAGWLITARATQGLGAAMVMPLSLTLLVAAFPPERRGTIVGIWGGLGGLAVAAGPLIGGAITQGVDWHWIFWVNVPVGLVALALIGLRIRESHGPATRLDLPAALMVSGGAIAVVWSLVRAGEDGWTSRGFFEYLLVGLALLTGFVAWESRANEPMLPLRLFRSRRFAAANLTGFLMTAAIFSAAFLVAQFFQLGLGYSPLDTGLRLLPWTATPLVVAPAAGVIADRIGHRPVLALGMLLQGLGLAWIAAIASAGAGYPSFVVPLVVAGIGISMALPIAPTAALSAVAAHDVGKASGLNSTTQRFGSAFGVAVAGAIFAAHGHLVTGVGFVDGFRPALAAVAGLSLVGVLTALAMGGRARPAMAAAPEKAAVA